MRATKIEMIGFQLKVDVIIPVRRP
jgi:hypothetical protein